MHFPDRGTGFEAQGRQNSAVGQKTWTFNPPSPSPLQQTSPQFHNFLSYPSHRNRPLIRLMAEISALLHVNWCCGYLDSWKELSGTGSPEGMSGDSSVVSRILSGLCGTPPSPEPGPTSAARRTRSVDPRTFDSRTTASRAAAASTAAAEHHIGRRPGSDSRNDAM